MAFLGNGYTIKTASVFHNPKSIVDNLYYKDNQVHPQRFKPGESYEMPNKRLTKVELITQLYRLEKLLYQMEKMMEKDEVKSIFWIGRPTHLEFERLLVVTQVRKQQLLKHLAIRMVRPPRRRSPKPRAHVTIHNIQWIQGFPENTRILFQQCVCVLFRDTVVYGSTVGTIRSNALLSFTGPYLFKNLPIPFNIKLKVFTINFDDLIAKKISVVVLPMMTLIGEAVLDMDSIYRGKGKFRIISKAPLPTECTIYATIRIEKSQMNGECRSNSKE